MKTLKKILIPTDFSEFSLSGIDCITMFEIISDARIYLLHVVSDTLLAPPFPNVDLNAGTILRDTMEDVGEELERIVSDRFRENKNITTIVRRGEPWKEIVTFASAEGIDLIVLATHGRTGLAHMLMGSVAEKVVRYSAVPVLTVKPQMIRDALIKEEDIEAQLRVNPQYQMRSKP